MYDCIIIGCGVTGAAAAYCLARDEGRVAVLEQSNDVANGTTKANSAILHAGYDPEPGTKMARLNVEGSKLAAEICQKLNVPYRRTGSLVLAFSDKECRTLDELYRRGVANGVPDLALLSGEGARALEPEVSDQVQGALYAPTAAVVNPWEYALAMAEVAVKNGVELYLEHPVTSIRKIDGGYSLTTPQGEFETKTVINAAGVHADQLEQLIAQPGYTIHAVRGEYWLLDKSEGDRVRHVIFQCPNEKGKGVLVAPTVHGNLIVGPNAESVENRDDVSCSTQGLSFVRDKARLSVPNVRFGENIRNFAGVRANSDSDDFLIGENPQAPGFFHLAGIKSPGLTAAPAIGLEAVRLVQEKGLAIKEKDFFDDSREHVVFRELDPEEKNRWIQKDPRYGRGICRCETVTEGEIVAAIHGVIPATTVNGVKRRCNAGMGRCQGGFCGPRVQAILARELGVDPTQVLMDGPGTVVLTGETKTGGGRDGI
mgnify:FL=1